ncbi:hypothetical protein POX_a00773 [Penicillium oxalicum]|uniref:hypothetical protein n=1 Tax=Penicillium oxalicum TaxID=69781 RepID=UPI0020B8551F|nr:hypothetical protein POX_a00773 [Penicillium oxalicum]KAI2794183.1 hypothetical protein POX_a00773 [Penicillium oxalicum]
MTLSLDQRKFQDEVLSRWKSEVGIPKSDSVNLAQLQLYQATQLGLGQIRTRNDIGNAKRGDVIGDSITQLACGGESQPGGPFDVPSDQVLTFLESQKRGYLGDGTSVAVQDELDVETDDLDSQARR